MNKTKIPWADYSINPVKGLCPTDCKDNRGKPYCYARRMYKRFKWNPEIHFNNKCLLDFYDYRTAPPAGSRIFVGSTMELFGDWIPEEWMEFIFRNVKTLGNRTFIFLTKQPQNLIKWSPFPENCWVGVSATDASMFTRAWSGLKNIQAPVKFVSFEPLLNWDMTHCDTKWTLETAGINWLIIGSRTQPTQHPPREWVDEIITAADKAKIPVFVKEPMASHFNIQRQEFPRYGGVNE